MTNLKYDRSGKNYMLDNENLIMTRYDVLMEFAKQYCVLHQQFKDPDDQFLKDFLDMEITWAVDALDRWYSSSREYRTYLKCKNSCVSRWFKKLHINLPKRVKNWWRKMKYKKCSKNDHIVEVYKKMEEMYENAFLGKFTNNDMLIKQQEEMIRSLSSRVKQLEKEKSDYVEHINA